MTDVAPETTKSAHGPVRTRRPMRRSADSE